MGFFVCLWWLGIRLLSRAGVRGRSRRIQFFFALPMIYLAAFLLVFAPLIASVANLSHSKRIPDSCVDFACSALWLGPFLYGLHRVVVWVASPEKRAPSHEETGRAEGPMPRAPQG